MTASCCNFADLAQPYLGTTHKVRLHEGSGEALGLRQNVNMTGWGFCHMRIADTFKLSVRCSYLAWLHLAFVNAD